MPSLSYLHVLSRFHLFQCRIACCMQVHTCLNSDSSTQVIRCERQWVWLCCHSNGEIWKPGYDWWRLIRHGHEVQTQGESVCVCECVCVWVCDVCVCVVIFVCDLCVWWIWCMLWWMYVYDICGVVCVMNVCDECVWWVWDVNVFDVCSMHVKRVCVMCVMCVCVCDMSLDFTYIYSRVCPDHTVSKEKGSVDYWKISWLYPVSSVDFDKPMKFGCII